ncbi:hypothetical protein [Pseudosulfitobacter sp. DSM 107133]|jgi:hypothetical protein|uniref:hypothetical protein n=1 Tax=Pseudosulfitobacter sp. DSM 107133 TaxID=2883100 RepID=UPI000DF3F120|nr:hypothetical protein [Pseudosulfitobacter sp. DSM 107133]UOA26448.1 hypothetical protein DSM107133_01148 [Pseudosulfitobacter sp. DSM 107133]
MRNAALTLGIIAGIIGLFVGFFSYGYTEAVTRYGEIEGLAEQVRNIGLVRTMAVLAPLLALAGGAMARARALWGGVLMLASALCMMLGFGWGVFTMFPITMAGLGGVLALAAGKPDRPVSHF